MPVSHKNGIAIASISHLNGIAKASLGAIGGIALPAGGVSIVTNTGQKFVEVGDGLTPDMVLSGSNIAIFGVLATIAFSGAPVPVAMTYEDTVRGSLTRNGVDVAFGFGDVGRFATFVATGVPSGSRDIGGDWDEAPIQAFIVAAALAGVSGFSNWQQLASQANGDNSVAQPASITLTGTTAGERYIVAGAYNSGNTPVAVTAGNGNTEILDQQQFDFLGGAFLMTGVAAGSTLTLGASLNQIAGAGDPPGNFMTWGLRGARADAA